MTGLIIKFKNITIGGLFLLAFVVYNHVYPGLNFLLMICFEREGLEDKFFISSLYDWNNLRRFYNLTKFQLAKRHIILTI